jgi:hypothetical protein
VNNLNIPGRPASLETPTLPQLCHKKVRKILSSLNTLSSLLLPRVSNPHPPGTIVLVRKAAQIPQQSEHSKKPHPLTKHPCSIAFLSREKFAQKLEQPEHFYQPLKQLPRASHLPRKSV